MWQRTLYGGMPLFLFFFIFYKSYTCNHSTTSLLVEVLLHLLITWGADCWAENWTLACCTESQSTTNRATPHLNELRRTLVSYTAACWAMTHPFEVQRKRTQLRRTITELRCTLVSYATPLRSYAAPYWTTPQPDSASPLPDSATPLPDSATPLPDSATPHPFWAKLHPSWFTPHPEYHSGFNWQHHYSWAVKYYFCDDHFSHAPTDVDWSVQVDVKKLDPNSIL